MKISTRQLKTTSSIQKYLDKYNLKLEPALKIDRKKKRRSPSEIHIVRVENRDSKEIFSTLKNFSQVEDIAFEPVYRVLHTPNDPFADPSLTSNDRQTPLHTHNFYEAWDIQQGDTNIIVGVVDTGIWFDHEDIKETIYYNYSDTLDGINNDGNLLLGDSLIDDFKGWDVADWDNDPTSSVSSHGLRVAGIIGATSNNGLGISGLVPNTRVLHIKASPDSSPNNITSGYIGLIYAVNQGCKIVNLSWGDVFDPGPIFKELIQDIVENYGVIIVAAAGNSNNGIWWYPASYPGVVSVSSIRIDSSKTNHGVFNQHVDFNAVGSYSKTLNLGATNAYVTEFGTSVAAPVIASAFALIKSQFPTYSNKQLIQQLRVTGFKNDTIGSNSKYEFKIGRMLDMKKALTIDNLPGYLVEDNNQPDTISISTYDTLIPFKLTIKNVLNSREHVYLRAQNFTENFNLDTTIDLSLSTNQSIEIDIPSKIDTIITEIDTMTLLLTYTQGDDYYDYEFASHQIKKSDCFDFGKGYGYEYVSPQSAYEPASFTLTKLIPNNLYTLSYKFNGTTASEEYTSDSLGSINVTNLDQGLYYEILLESEGCNYVYSDEFDLSFVTAHQDTNSEISFYPNPVNNILKILGEKITKIEIFSIQGERIKTIKDPKNQINIQPLPSGTFLFKTFLDGKIFYSKISKL